jgi:hypothetical protein
MAALLGLSENLNLFTPRDFALRRLTPRQKGALRSQNRSRSRSWYRPTRKRYEYASTMAKVLDVS